MARVGFVAEWERVIDGARSLGLSLTHDRTSLVLTSEDPGAFTFVELTIGEARELRDALTDMIARSEEGAA